MKETINKEVSGTNYLFSRRPHVNDEMQKRFAEKRWVWVPDKKEMYVSGFVVEESGDTVEVECSGRRMRVKGSEVFKMNPPKFDMAEDLAELSYLNEPSVLYNLRRRYQKELIYTYSGLFLLAINPYRNLRIYGGKEVRRYTLHKKYELEPHIFGVANEAYNSMLSARENQSILITGESGAGKTENTKRVIEFLARVAGYRGEGTRIERQIIDANPILEAFGNAQTVKNDNSSRFGKFVKIKFNGGSICGAHIEKYLLEKSRVTHQHKDERNYHVFYQLLRGGSVELKKRLFLSGDVEDYRFLRGTRTEVANVCDGSEFGRLVEAMNVLRIPEEEQEGYFRIVSAILHLGNMEFGERDGTAEITNIEVAERVCKLLSIPLGSFIRNLIHPVMKAGNEYVTHNRSREQAERIVEALARMLYDKMFDRVVCRLNKTLSSSYAGNFIGVLDIAGFEIFKENSFEQLCINYTNEKLQQFFNHHMFILEQEVYKQESIEWDFIDFGLDLQPTIDLIEKNNPIGILSYLDEESVMPQATEKSFLEKLSRNIKSRKFCVSRLKEGFVVSHYAGDVEYVVEGWLSKNKDPHSESLTGLIETSEDGEVGKLELQETGVKKGIFRTVGQKHKEQLESLMSELYGTQPHFVRCILPNLEKSGEYLENGLVLEQLKCNGVLEGIRISRQGFPSRMRYQEFVGRYGVVVGLEMSLSGWDGTCGEDFREMTERILCEIKVSGSQYRLGQSKVFFRQGVLADIEDMRDSRVSSVMRSVEALIRKKLAFRKYHRTQRRMQKIVVLQRNGRICCSVQRWNWWRLYVKIKPLLEVRKRDNEISEKEARLSACMEALSSERKRGVELEEKLRSVYLEKETVARELEKEKRFSVSKEELVMGLRQRNEELGEEVRGLCSEVSRLSEVVLSHEGVVEDLGVRVNSGESEIERLAGVVSEQRERICEQEGQIVEMERQLVRKAHEEKAEIERELGEKSGENRKLRERIREQEERIRGMLSEIGELKEGNSEKEERIRESEKAAEDAAAECKRMRRWKEEYERAVSKHESVERKMREEIEDLQLENERMSSEVCRMGRLYEEAEMGRRKTKEEAEVERSRGEKLEKALQGLRGEFSVVEGQLAQERQFKDSTQESLEGQIRGLEKKVRMLTERIRGAESVNKQLVGEKDEVYREMQVLQKSKLDEIFAREAEFNSVRKGLQMEIQKLCVENQRLQREVAEARVGNETSEESVCGTERLYMMVEEEKRKRREVEHELASQENRNVVLCAEMESLREAVESERAHREEESHRQEQEKHVGKMIGHVRKEVEMALNEVRLVSEGFNTGYAKILEGYKRDLSLSRERVLEKEDGIEELECKLCDARREVERVTSRMEEGMEKYQEVVEQYDVMREKLEVATVRCLSLETMIGEKDEEIKRYEELYRASVEGYEEVWMRMDQEIGNLGRNDDERRKCMEEVLRSFDVHVGKVRGMEDEYRTHAEEGIRQIMEMERQRLAGLEQSYNQLMSRYGQLQEEQRGVLEERASLALRQEQLCREIDVLKERERSARSQAVMYESEICTLRRCVKFREEVVGSLQKDKGPAVVYVCDKEKWEAEGRRRMAAEQSVEKMREEVSSQTAVAKRLREEAEGLRDDIARQKQQLVEARKSLGQQSLVVSRLTKELEEEREMVRFLKPLTLIRKKKS